MILRDIDVRLALHKVVLARFHRDPNSVVADELFVGEARADVVVVNGALHGYEIKSDRDDLIRLPHQVKAYNACMDYMTLVAGERHVAKAADIVPAWWGITAVIPGKRTPHFKTLRRCRHNPSIEPYAIAAFLWRNEAVEFLEERGFRGVRSWPCDAVWQLVAATVPLEEICNRVRDILKKRLTDRADEPQKPRVDLRPRQPMSSGCLLAPIHLHKPE